jgi:hypothetical protein
MCKLLWLAQQISWRLNSFDHLGADYPSYNSPAVHAGSDLESVARLVLNFKGDSLKG